MISVVLFQMSATNLMDSVNVDQTLWEDSVISKLNVRDIRDIRDIVFCFQCLKKICCTMYMWTKHYTKTMGWVSRKSRRITFFVEQCKQFYIDKNVWFLFSFNSANCSLHPNACMYSKSLKKKIEMILQVIMKTTILMGHFLKILLGGRVIPRLKTSTSAL